MGVVLPVAAGAKEFAGVAPDIEGLLPVTGGELAEGSVEMGEKTNGALVLTGAADVDVGVGVAADVATGLREGVGGACAALEGKGV